MILTKNQLTPEITFKEETHQYFLEDKELKSVSTYLAEKNPEKAQSLKEVDAELLGFSQRLGRYIHKLDELFWLKQSLDTLEATYSYFEEYKSIMESYWEGLKMRVIKLKKLDLHIWAKELIVSDHEEYAGTIDTVWCSNNPDIDGKYKLWIEDIKTGNRKYAQEAQLDKYEELLTISIEKSNLENKDKYKIVKKSFWFLKK